MRSHLFVFLILLFGCTGIGQQDCGRDKKCLEEAFVKCEKQSGIWEGQNGEINIRIIGPKGGDCGVSVQILNNWLNISNKTMTCYLPMNQSDNFSIKTNCTGELRLFFTNES